MNDPLIAEVLAEVVPTLEAEGIEYAVTGSVASSIYGEPAASFDVDIIVRMTPEQARRIAQRFPSRFYRDAEAIAEAAVSHGMTNLIDMKTGLKVDLSVMPAGAWRDDILRRRSLMRSEPHSRTFYIVSPEDIILMKLDWRRDSGSHKQWDNALSVARTLGARLDWGYLHAQASNLGLSSDLDRLRREAMG
ncbi:MAG: hypothetical protein BroJett003_10330 [Planctomycetota bacterium]|nr:MAG: hypothetical protein BroJett003_10330 [Planctomycetota bacterium]